MVWFFPVLAFSLLVDTRCCRYYGGWCWFGRPFRPNNLYYELDFCKSAFDFIVCSCCIPYQAKYCEFFPIVTCLGCSSLLILGLYDDVELLVGGCYTADSAKVLNPLDYIRGYFGTRLCFRQSWRVVFGVAFATWGCRFVVPRFVLPLAVVFFVFRCFILFYSTLSRILFDCAMR